MDAALQTPVQEDFEASVVEIDAGHSLRVLQAGEGDPVVLIHGALGMAEDMALGLFPSLSGRYRAIAIDRPGHGGSRRQRFESSPARQVALIREGLGRLGIERPVVVAHSIGGPVGLTWARAHPEEVRGLVLLAPAAYPEFRPIEHTYLSPRATPGFGPLLSRAAGASVDPGMLPQIEKAMFAPQVRPDDWVARFPHDQVRRPEQLVVNGEDMAEMPALGMLALSYRTIRTPTVILSGDRDLIVDPKRHARALVQALPNAELEMLPGLGHMIHHFAADRIAAAVDRLAIRGK